MDDYDRRVRFAHRFASPMTSMKAGLALLQRQAAKQHTDAQFTDLLDLLERSAARLREAFEMINESIVDATDVLRIVVPDERLIEIPAKPSTTVVHGLAAQAGIIQKPQINEPTTSLRPSTVLLIEDSPTYRAAMSAHLDSAGFDVVMAADGPSGLDIARAEQPEVIVLDYMLPHINGSQMAYILGEDPETKHIPIVIYTALDASELTHMDPRLHIVHKDEALEVMPPLLQRLIDERQRSTAAHILVVEDDLEINDLLTKGLAQEGYSVTSTTRGEEGLSLSQRQPFDLIVLDVVLPDLDGMSVLRRIRSWSQTAATPTMMVSALNHPSEKIRALQLGADDYVTKPFNMNELLARIETSLRRREVEGSANPSTMLPGNRSIERTITTRIEAGVPFAVGYCDIDHFKAYNDTYGFLKGDAAIHQTARIVTAAVEKHGTPRDFVGHIGGDDFIFVTHPNNVPAICEAIIEEFDRLVPLYYDQETRSNGTLQQYDRDGNWRTFPLMTISVGVVTSVNNQITHFAQVGDIAADLKKRAKAQPGSTYLVDQVLTLRSA